MRRYVRMITMGTFASVLAVAVLGGGVAVGTESSTTTTTTTVQEPTGKLVIADATTRSFRLGTESKVYVAPPTVDLSSLDGSEVKVYLNDTGEVSRVTKTTETTIEED
jgi:hypothetical protein